MNREEWEHILTVLNGIDADDLVAANLTITRPPVECAPDGVWRTFEPGRNVFYELRAASDKGLGGSG